MKVLDRRTTSDLVKLLVFIVVTTLATSVLVVLIGNISFTPKHEYRAVFVDATGVVKGDDIRIAGVKVGTVKGVEVVDRTRARVTFSVDDTETLSARRPTRRSATATSSASATSRSPTRSGTPAS